MQSYNIITERRHFLWWKISTPYAEVRDLAVIQDGFDQPKFACDTKNFHDANAHRKSLEALGVFHRSSTKQDRQFAEDKARIEILGIAVAQHLPLRA